MLIYLLALLSAVYAIFFYSKGSFLLWLNDQHNVFLDVFFKYITHLGDGLIYAALIAILLLWRYYYAIVLIFIMVVQTVPVQIVKRFVFKDNPRPKAYFEGVNDVVLNYVDGVKIHTANSFPSGHTASAFAIALFLMFITRKPALRLLVMLLAIMVGLSRIYLNLHFLEDVAAGSLIGTLSSIIVLWILEEKWTYFKKNDRLRKGLLFNK